MDRRSFLLTSLLLTLTSARTRFSDRRLRLGLTEDVMHSPIADDLNRLKGYISEGSLELQPLTRAQVPALLDKLGMVLTSKSHAVLSIPDAHVFAEFPFGLGGIDKLNLLREPEVTAERSGHYLNHGWYPLLLGVTPNQVGIAVRRGRRNTPVKVVVKDLSAEQLAARGLEPVEVKDVREMISLLRGDRLDVSLAMPATFWKRLGWDWQTFKYVEMNARHSGHPIDLAIRKEVWNRFSPLHKSALSRLVGQYSVELTRRLDTSETAALHAIENKSDLYVKSQVIREAYTQAIHNRLQSKNYDFANFFRRC